MTNSVTAFDLDYSADCYLLGRQDTGSYFNANNDDGYADIHATAQIRNIVDGTFNVRNSSATNFLQIDTNSSDITLGVANASLIMSNSLEYANLFASGSVGLHTTLSAIDIYGGTTGNIEMNTPFASLHLDNANKAIELGGAVAFNAVQNYTAGGDVTISDGTASISDTIREVLQATAAITLPSAPVNGQMAKMTFGGTVGAGTVVTLLTLALIQGRQSAERFRQLPRLIPHSNILISNPIRLGFGQINR